MYLPKDALLPAVFFPCPGRGAGGAVRDEAVCGMRGTGCGVQELCGMKPCTGCGVPAEPLDGGAAQGEGARAVSSAGVRR